MASDKRYGEGFGKPAATVTATAAKAAVAVTSGLSSISLPSGQMLVNGVQWLFYGSVLTLFLFLLLVVLHYTTYPIFSFGSNDDEGIITLPSGASAQTAFVAGPAPSDRIANFTDLRPFAVTYGMTLKLDGSVTGTSPRVLMYRAAASTPAPSTDSGLAAAYPNSNMVLYMDPYVNDLYVMVRTATTYITKRVIKNAPLGTPFRVVLVIQPKYVEAYLDGQLVETVLTPNGADLVDIDPAYNVWGPPAATGVSAKLAYLTYWPYVLTPKSVRVDAAKSRDTAILS